uniref:Uncharacterized protein n=1 Tax=Anguilla anguilla TaxID=7936 RepID=A0A0E9UP27_ANGAN
MRRSYVSSYFPDTSGKALFTGMMLLEVDREPYNHNVIK